MPQRKLRQRIETTAPIMGGTDLGKASQHHISPGLIELLKDFFWHPRKLHLTTRGVAREKRVAETYVITAILRDMKREIHELRQLVGHGRRADFIMIQGQRAA